MPATVDLQRRTGPTGTIVDTDVTSTDGRLSASDVVTPGTTNAIQIPTSGTNYSYWASYRLNAKTTPTGTINNIRLYFDGSNQFGTGITAKGAKASTGADAGYREATASVGVTGTALTQALHSGLDEAPVNVFNFKSAAPKSLTGSISNPSTGQFGDHFVIQVEVTNIASAGASGLERMTWVYDET